MLRRDFFKLLVEASAALSAPHQVLGSSIVPKVAELFPKDLLDSFLDFEFVSSLRLGQRGTKEHPYSALENAASQISDLINCILHPSPSAYRFVPSNHHLLRILGRDSLWENGATGKISLDTWIKFGEALEQHTLSILQLPNAQLIKRFPEFQAEAKRPIRLEEFEDSLLLRIAELHRSKVIGTDLASGLRGLICYRQNSSRKILFAISDLKQARAADYADVLAKHPDTQLLLDHIQEFGFSPFPEGSRLAKLQSVAQSFRRFNNLQGQAKHFLRQKKLAEDLNLQSRELGFELPQKDTIDSACYSNSFGEYQKRSYSGNRSNASFHVDYLERQGLAKDFCLIYNYRPQGTIISLFCEAQNRFLPTHVHFNKSINIILNDILWENMPTEKLLSNQTLLLRVSCSQDDIDITTTEIQALSC